MALMAPVKRAVISAGRVMAPEDEGESSGFQRLDSLLRVMDMALGEDLAGHSAASLWTNSKSISLIPCV